MAPFARAQAEEAFYRIAGRSAGAAQRVAQREQSAADGADAAQAPPYPGEAPAPSDDCVALGSLTTVLALLNLAVAPEELAPIVRDYAAPGSPHGTAGPLKSLRFDWPGVVALYDRLVPSQNATLKQYFALFHLLDPDGVGQVQLADLRHAMTRSGPHPLTEAEFNHGLYRHRLLHRATVSLFEYVRLLLDVPMPPLAAVVIAAMAEDAASVAGAAA